MLKEFVAALFQEGPISRPQRRIFTTFHFIDFGAFRALPNIFKHLRLLFVEESIAETSIFV